MKDIDRDLRTRLHGELAAKFKKASGRNVVENGVDQWDALADILITMVIELIDRRVPQLRTDPGSILVGGQG